MHPQLLLLWSPQLGARSSLDVYEQKMNNKNLVHVHGDKLCIRGENETTTFAGEWMTWKMIMLNKTNLTLKDK